MSARRAMTEAQLHKAVAHFLSLAIGPKSECVWTTFPAGGGGKVRGAQLKARGLRAGWPDIQLLARVPTTIAGPPFKSQFIGIELKTDKGSVSPEQAACFGEITAVGGRMFVCRSVEDVATVLKIFAIPVSAHTFGAGVRRAA